MTTDIITGTDSIQITAGPGTTELWDAAKYALSKKFTVHFCGVRTTGRVKIAVRLKMQITGLQYEDGTGHSFIVNAYILNSQGVSAYQGLKTFYYNAQARTGHLDLK